MVGGTFAFIAFSVLSGVGIFFMRRMSKFTKDEAQIACISNVVAWFCMWLMWLCTWLHQWHPVIRPTHKPEEHAAAAGASAASSGGHRLL